MDDDSSMASNRFNCCKRNFEKIQKRPWFIWLISIVEIIVFIAELGRNWWLTGTPIQIKPSFNPMIGPSAYVLINMGARFSPCMHTVEEVPDIHAPHFPCPNYTGSAEQTNCTLSELCGFGGVSRPPNQWYRLVLPIFLHGGLVHLLVNVITQLIMGISIERKIGAWRLALIYFLTGIFGNIVSGNFAPVGSASVGCSGSLFGIVALYLLQLLFNWKKTSCCQLITFTVGILIDLVLGILPILDNFGHIGGFMMGLLLGLVFLDSPSRFRRLSQTHRERETKSQWWIWLILRLVFLFIATVLFVLSILNIYLWKMKCTWCQYLNCLPVHDWCDSAFFEPIQTINPNLTTETINRTIQSTTPTTIFLLK